MPTCKQGLNRAHAPDRFTRQERVPNTTDGATCAFDSACAAILRVRTRSGHEEVVRFMKGDTADSPPEGSIPFDPEMGFAPLLSSAFVASYGSGSVFVTATADCLTWGVTQLLIHIGRVPDGTEPIQHGAPQARVALEQLLARLEECGLIDATKPLYQSAAGFAEPREFEQIASSCLGASVVESWLHALEGKDYSGASATLGLSA